ncbi:MAG: hypothetical protein HC804_08725 [Anaerolineae bacterium]|nr:hypothetical protein [Anaerolineae bacterium]
MPRLDRSGRNRAMGRGDMHVIVQVAIPKKLNKEQQRLFKELSKSLGKEVIPRSEKGIFDQLKDALGDVFGA